VSSGEFGKVGDSEEELADSIFLLLIPFYNPYTVDFHVLMVLSIGESSMQCCFL